MPDWGDKAHTKMTKEGFRERVVADRDKATKKKNKKERGFNPQKGNTNPRKEMYGYLLPLLEKEFTNVKKAEGGISFSIGEESFTIKVVLKKERLEL